MPFDPHELVVRAPGTGRVLFLSPPTPTNFSQTVQASEESLELRDQVLGARQWGETLGKPHNRAGGRVQKQLHGERAPGKFSNVVTDLESAKHVLQSR